MSGFVSFVGSGPGDPDLLTLKAVARLRAAEVVLFDDLSAAAMLGHTGRGAELVAVGKRAGRPSPRQDHVSRLLVDYAMDGARVVRLKSGDPGLFGRLEEEIVACRAAGIGFEIVPGVSSASAAAAAAGIPLTRRLSARRVQFLTGHDVRGALPEGMRLEALADPEATTVVFMPRRTFAALAAQLIAAGLPPDTPALLAENISHPDQRMLWSSVGGLREMLAEAGGTGAPTLILYGPLAEGAG